jgi:hypothetical protein
MSATARNPALALRPAWKAVTIRLSRIASGRAQPKNPDVADQKAAEEEILKRLFELDQVRAKQDR